MPSVPRRRRSRRSYVVEMVLGALAIAFIWAFLNFGWYEEVGRWLADRFSP